MWKYENEILTPIMWFGLDNEVPLDNWTAYAYDEEETSLWFVDDDEWSVMSILIGDDDVVFLTWYLMEQGRMVPSISEIKDTCPIQWDENDSENDLSQKISMFMFELQKRALPDVL